MTVEMDGATMPGDQREAALFSFAAFCMMHFVGERCVIESYSKCERHVSS